MLETLVTMPTHLHTYGKIGNYRRLHSLQRKPFLKPHSRQVQKFLMWMSLAKTVNVCTHIHPLPNTEKLMGYDSQFLQEEDRRREVKVFLLFLFDNSL